MGIISPIDIKLTGSSYWCVYVDIFWLVNMFVSLDLLQRTWVIYGCSWRCWRRRTHTTCSSRLKWKRSVDNVLFLYNYCQILKAFHEQMLLVKAEEKLGYFLCSLGISPPLPPPTPKYIVSGLSWKELDFLPQEADFNWRAQNMGTNLLPLDICLIGCFFFQTS